MDDTSRRKFLAVAGAGAAAGVTGVVVPTVAHAAAGAASTPVVAYIEDAAGSEISLMVGEDEVVVNDRDLVVRILNAAGGR
jgi:hypothetical protein